MGTSSHSPLLVVVAALAGLAAMKPTPAAADCAPGRQCVDRYMTIYVPFSPDVEADAAVELLRPALQRLLGDQILKIYDSGDFGASAIQLTSVLPSSGRNLVATSIQTRVFVDTLVGGDTPLSSLTPIAKLTGAFSGTLFVGPESKIRNWKDFAAEARKRQLRIAYSRPYDLRLALLRRALKVSFSEDLKPTTQGVIGDVMGDYADAAILGSPTLLGLKALDLLPNIRPIVTFGPERDAALGVPTLAEVSGVKDASATDSIGVFAPPNTPPDVAKTLTAAFIAAGEDPAAQTRAEVLGLPLQVTGPDTVRADMTRDATIVRAMRSQLNPPETAAQTDLLQAPGMGGTNEQQGQPEPGGPSTGGSTPYHRHVPMPSPSLDYRQPQP